MPFESLVAGSYKEYDGYLNSTHTKYRQQTTFLGCSRGMLGCFVVATSSFDTQDFQVFCSAFLLVYHMLNNFQIILRLHEGSMKGTMGACFTSFPIKHINSFFSPSFCCLFRGSVHSVWSPDSILCDRHILGIRPRIPKKSRPIPVLSVLDHRGRNESESTPPKGGHASETGHRRAVCFSTFFFCVE